MWGTEFLPWLVAAAIGVPGLGAEGEEVCGWSSHSVIGTQQVEVLGSGVIESSGVVTVTVAQQTGNLQIAGVRTLLDLSMGTHPWTSGDLSWYGSSALASFVGIGGTDPVPGSVFSNVLVQVKGYGLIDTDAASGGTVQVLENGSITGQIIQGAPTISLLSASSAVEAAMITNDNAQIPATTQGNNPVGPGPSLVLSGSDSLTLPAGSYYFVQIDLSSLAGLSVGGPVKIYLDGAADFSGGAINSSGNASDLLVISRSTLPINLGGAAVATLGIYAPEATVTIESARELTGGVAAKEVNVDVRGKITYDLSLSGLCAVDSVCEPQSGTFTETFDTQVYEDVTSTTAYWNTVEGQLTLPADTSDQCWVAQEPTIEGSTQIDDAVFPIKSVIEGDRLYVAFPYVGVRIFDISDPTVPVLMGTVEPDGDGYHLWSLSDLDVQGDRLYLAGSGYQSHPESMSLGVLIMDVSDPSAPVHLGSIGGRSRGIVVREDRVYVSRRPRGIKIYDVADPEAPVLLAQECSPRVRGLALRDDALFAGGCHKLRVFDTQSLPDIPEIDSSPTEGPGWRVTLAGNRAHVSNLWGGLSTVDAQDVTSLTTLSTYRYEDLWSWDSKPGCNEDLTYSVFSAGWDPLVVLDMTDASEPVPLWVWEPDEGFRGTTVAMSGFRAYVAGWQPTVGHAALYVGRLGEEMETFITEGVGQSTVVSGAANDITHATLSAQEQLGVAGSAQYELSNDGGASWSAVQPGNQIVFSSAGDSLLWRSTLSTGDEYETPVVDEVNIQYQWGCVE